MEIKSFEVCFVLFENLPWNHIKSLTFLISKAVGVEIFKVVFLELFEFVESVDNNCEKRFDADITPSVLLQSSFLLGSEWSLVIPRSRLPCLRNDSAHEIELTVVETD